MEPFLYHRKTNVLPFDAKAQRHCGDVFVVDIHIVAGPFVGMNAIVFEIGVESTCNHHCYSEIPSGTETHAKSDVAVGAVIAANV